MDGFETDCVLCSIYLNVDRDVANTLLIVVLMVIIDVGATIKSSSVLRRAARIPYWPDIQQLSCL